MAKKPRAKVERCWAVYSPGNWLLTWTVTPRRGESIRVVLDSYGGKGRELRSQGYTVARVTITPAK